MLDLAIVGAGPAALSAAIYATRGNLSVQVFEKAAIGGLLNEISRIENFPGFVGAGATLATQLKQQALDAGVQFSYGECTSLEFNKNRSCFELVIDDEKVLAKTVLVATGSEPKHLSIVPNKPVSYCVLCDGNLYHDQNVVMVGGGNSAIQESLYLAGIVKHLTVISRSKLRAEPCLIEKLTKFSNVTICENTKPTEELLNQFDGVFVCIGKRPATKFLPTQLLDSDGYIKTTDHMTELPGLFAAGDVRSGAVRQAITAAADGATAALEITNYLKTLA